MTDVQAIARATVNDARKPRRVAHLRDALAPHAAENRRVLEAACARLDDMADSGKEITTDRAARAVDEARAFVADGGRVCLAGWVAS